MTSSDSAGSSARSNQEAKPGPESNDIPASAIVTPAASPKKSKKKSRRAPADRSGQSGGGSKEAPKNETVPIRQDDINLDPRPLDFSGPPQGSPVKGADDQANKDGGSRRLELNNGDLVTDGLMSQSIVAGTVQSSSRSPAKLFLARAEAPAGGISPNTTTKNDMGQKMEKRRSKKNAAVEADQCERHHHTSDGIASSSVSDPAARRAMVVDMLSRMAGGGPASGAGGGAAAQGSSSSISGGGYRDFTFLLPPPTESRKCRLCRNMFTDKSNVKQADGGAPCSFHPGTYFY